MSDSGTEKSKKPRWKVIRALENNLRLLKRGRRAVRAALISMLQVAKELREEDDEKRLVVIAGSVVRKGHTYATVNALMDELAAYSPQLLKPSIKDFKGGKNGSLTYACNDVLREEIKIWNKLDGYGAVNDSERSDVQKLSQLLDELYGSRERIVA